MAKIDSVAARNLFSNSLDSLSHLQEKVSNKVTSLARYLPGSKYTPFLDTLKTSLNFLHQYSSELRQFKNVRQQISGSLNNVQQLEGQLQQVEQIQQYLQERQQLLTQSLNRQKF